MNIQALCAQVPIPFFRAGDTGIVWSNDITGTLRLLRSFRKPSSSTAKMMASMVATVLLFVNPSLSLFLPFRSPLSSVHLNSSILTKPLMGPHHLTLDGWPEIGYRYEIPRTDLHLTVRGYGRSVPLRWVSIVAYGIQQLEEQLGQQPLHRIDDFDAKSGPVEVFFLPVEGKASITSREAAEALGSILAFTAAFGPREVNYCLVETANGEETGIALDLDLDSRQRSGV